MSLSQSISYNFNSNSKDTILTQLKINNNKNITKRWVDFVKNHKSTNCNFCGCFNTTTCIICGKYECDPKPNISLYVNKSENSKELRPFINQMQNLYNDAIIAKKYDVIASIIELLNDNKIKYINILEDQENKLYPTYQNLLNQLSNAILNHDIDEVNELINMGVVPTESMLYDVIRTNLKMVFSFDKKITCQIAEIIIREFVQIEKSIVIEAIINADINVVKLFVEKSVLCEDIYSEIAGLGYLTLLKYLDSKNCPKNQIALFNIAYNRNISFNDKIKVMQYLTSTGCDTLSSEFFDTPKIFDSNVYNWIITNCNKYDD